MRMPNAHLACAPASIEESLSEAEELCARRGGNLTPLRRKVLSLLLASDRPVKAYDLLQHLRDDGESKPPTIYRALDFLLDMGLAHKVESLGAFTRCGHWRHGHAAIFLICSGCGEVQELHADETIRKLAKDVASVKFRMQRSVIEVLGLCAHCV